ncbi:Fc.00g018500.m01.CDS01 [Cosmosporella sp. VM-42]
MAPTVIAFDLYGTLLSTESIAQLLATFYGDEKARTIAAQARRYQLESTWRINSMGMYRTFSDLTRASFRQATTEAGVTLSGEQEERIMNAYDGLDTFPEVDAALDILSGSPSLDPYVFSNGTASMITSSIRTSPALSRAGSLLSSSKVVSIDPLGVFKPDRRTYEHMCKTVGQEGHPENLWLVSSNPFDIVGAAAVGFNTAWVDRGGAGWIDSLGAAMDLSPTVVVKGVDEAVGEILNRRGKE